MRQKIKSVRGREILDSMGNPTVEAEVCLESGIKALGRVPNGVALGKYEALELRDNDMDRFGGKGVQKAVWHIDNEVQQKLKGVNINNIAEIDRIMMEIDQTKDKSHLGANTILAVSFACVKAAAEAAGKELYQYISQEKKYSLPLHLDNCVDGGRNCLTNHLDFRGFMIAPVGAQNFHDGVRMCVEVYQMLKKILEREGYETNVGDEGGFVSALPTAFEVFGFMMEAVGEAGYEPGKDIAFALDAAASELYQPENGLYYFEGETIERFNRIEQSEKNLPETDAKVLRSTEEMIEMYEELVEKYPLIAIEDGLDQEDWEGWVEMTRRLRDKVLLVGDDLFATNVERLKKGIEMGAANAVLIKPNQIGSMTETIETVRYAKEHGYKTIFSHRSGETEDDVIADLAVGLNSGYIKMGAPCRGEHTAKYNRLLRIAEALEI